MAPATAPGNHNHSLLRSFLDLDRDPAHLVGGQGPQPQSPKTWDDPQRSYRLLHRRASALLRAAAAMNLFRLAGDLSHLAAIIILLLKIWKTRSCAGISGEKS